MIKSETARLALDTILQKPTQGIPSWLIHPMEHRMIDRLAGVPEGTYRAHPEETYLAMQRKVGTCLLDQYLATNPLSMGDHGYEEATKGGTAGTQVVCDGRVIDSPEAVVEHMERFEFPRLIEAARTFDLADRVKKILAEEERIQALLGPTLLKSGYGFIPFPVLPYGPYRFEDKLMTIALYPEVMEKCCALQADLNLLQNRAASIAYTEGHLPPLYRLDYDMADTRGTMIDIKVLDKIWFPHFARSLDPLLKTDVRLIWHCDGNLSQMVPRLLDVGLRGFQGFQYEYGMDYEAICRMKDREGRDLVIVGGVSVTRTLPLGTPDDVRKELKWLVDYGPRTGLFLACTSSIAPGVPWDNLRTLVEGLQYYRTHGRDN